MSALNIFDTIFLLLAILSQYSIGKRVGVRALLSGSLIGVSVSSLIIAILANHCAEPISRIAVYAIVIAGLVTVWDLYRYVFKTGISKEVISLYIVLAIFLCFLLTLNNPWLSLVQKNLAGNYQLLFYDHFSYYSSQSTEMLRAEYCDRLRIANVYPFAWIKYHFFNAATQALSQALLGEPGLFSFFSSQVLFAALIFLSFVETILKDQKINWTMIAVVIFWFLLGLTLFAPSIKWNLMTTGPLSVFAAVQMLFAVYRSSYRESLIYAVLLSVSAVRLLPFAAIASCYIFFVFLCRNPLELNWRNVFKVGLFPLAALVLAGIYNFVTVLSGETPKILNSVGGDQFDGWLYPLASYKVFGFLISESFSVELAGRFWLFNKNGFFDGLLTNGYIKVFFLVSLVALCCWMLWCWGQNWLERRKLLSIWGIAIVFAGLISTNAVWVSIICLPYVLIAMGVNDSCNVDNREKSSRLLLVFVLQFLSLMFLYKGADGLSAPVAFVIFDVFLWGLLGVFFSQHIFSSRSIVVTVLGGIILLTSFPLWISHWLHPGRDSQISLVDITQFVGSDFDRSEFVAEDGMLKSYSEDPVENDTHSAFLGAHMPYVAAYRQHIFNYNWVKASAVPKAVQGPRAGH